jgi:hypothetical protein
VRGDGGRAPLLLIRPLRPTLRWRRQATKRSISVRSMCRRMGIDPHSRQYSRSSSSLSQYRSMDPGARPFVRPGLGSATMRSSRLWRPEALSAAPGGPWTRHPSRRRYASPRLVVPVERRIRIPFQVKSAHNGPSTERRYRNHRTFRLTEQLGRHVSFTSKMGPNVAHGFSTTQRQRASKSILSGCGFENGASATVGATKKGKIWSHQRIPIDGLIDWFHLVGEKITNEQINPDEVLRGTLEPVPVGVRPRKLPRFITWPEDVITSIESNFPLFFDGGSHAGLYETEIVLEVPTVDRELQFKINCPSGEASLKLDLFTGEDGNLDFSYSYVAPGRLLIPKGINAGRNDAIDICDYFNSNPPVIWFVDGSPLEGNQYTELRSTSLVAISFGFFRTRKGESAAWQSSRWAVFGSIDVSSNKR